MLYNASMNEYPKTFADFEKQFGTEEQCREYLFQLKWPNGFVCPKCGNNKAWITDKKEYKCQACKQKTTLTTGTMFHGTHIPLSIWFKGIWYFSTKTTKRKNVLEFQGAIGLENYRTARKMFAKIGLAWISSDKEKLQGKVVIEEICYEQGKNICIVLAFEIQDKNDLNKVRAAVVEDTSSKRLHSFFEKNIEKGSTIISKGGSCYDDLSQMGYLHENLADRIYDSARFMIVLYDDLLQMTLKDGKWLDINLILDVFAYNVMEGYSIAGASGFFYRILRIAVQSAIFDDVIDYYWGEK